MQQMEYVIQTSIKCNDDGATQNATRIASSLEVITKQAMAANTALEKLNQTARKMSNAVFQNANTSAGKLVGTLGNVFTSYSNINNIGSKMNSKSKVKVALKADKTKLANDLLQGFDLKLGGNSLSELKKITATMQTAESYINKIKAAGSSLPNNFQDLVSLGNKFSTQMLAAGNSKAVVPSNGKGGKGGGGALGLSKGSQLPLNKSVKETFTAINELVNSKSFKQLTEGSPNSVFTKLTDHSKMLKQSFTDMTKGVFTPLIDGAKKLDACFSDNSTSLMQVVNVVKKDVIPAIRESFTNAKKLYGEIKNLHPEMVKVARKLEFVEKIGNKIIGRKASGTFADLLDGKNPAFNRQLKKVKIGFLTSARDTRKAGARGSKLSYRAARLSSSKGVMGKLTSPLAGAKGFLRGFTKGLPNISRLLGPVTRLLPMIGTSLAPIAAGAAAIAVVAAVVATAVAGAMMVVKSNLFGMGDWFQGSIGNLMDTFKSIGASLWGLFKGVAIPLGCVIIPIVIFSMETLAFTLKAIIAVFNALGGMVAGVSAFLGAILANPFRPGQAAEIAMDAAKNFDMANILADVSTEPAAKSTEASKQSELAGKKAVSGPGNVNISGDIIMNNQYQEDVSPDRIAFGLFDELENQKSQRPQVRSNAAI